MFHTDAGRTAGTRPLQCRGVALGHRTAKAPAKGLSTLNSMAFGLAVYASQCRLPFYENWLIVKSPLLVFALQALQGRLELAQAEDRATQRCDPSAALGPKSKPDGWKRFQPLGVYDLPCHFEFGRPR
jgi:hypothetical protein